jgi:formylmethanofuran dehydrogenase subunit A
MQNLSTHLTLTASDLTRFGKDELYRMAEQKISSQIGSDIDIDDMNIIPKKIEDDEYVRWLFKPTSYTVNGVRYVQN